MDARTAMERLRTMLPGWTSPTIPISTDAAKTLLDALDEMALALEDLADAARNSCDARQFPALTNALFAADQALARVRP